MINKNFAWNKYKLESIHYKLLNRPVVIYGAGQGGESAKSYLERLGYSIEFFSDSDKEKHDKFFYGIKCISNLDIENVKNVFVVVSVNTKFDEVSNFLNNKNIENINFDSFAISNSFDKLRNIYSMLYDEYSRNTFTNILLSRFYNNISFLEEISVGDQYFCIDKFNSLAKDEVIVDCGAYIGDTLEQCISKSEKFEKYYAFEPYRINYLRLSDYVIQKRQTKYYKDRLIVENKAVGNSDSYIYFVNDLKKISPGIQVKVCSKSNKGIRSVKLDTYFKNKKKPTFIKADIEGDELNLLHGAENIIKTSSPKIAICMYHKFEHLYSLVEYIYNLNKNYKFSIRHHSKTSFAETVLYAWV